MKKSKTATTEEYQGGASKPISLAPLSTEEALRGLLAVKPIKKAKKAEKKKAVKKASKK